MQAPSERNAQRPARPRWRRPLKWLLGSIFTLLLLVAAVLGTFGIIVGRVPEYRVQVQDWIGDRTGLVVEFRALSARLRLFGPELVFDDAIVRTPDRTQVLATAQRGSVGFDIWSSLRNGQLSAGRFSLRAPQINLIRTREGRIQLLGQSALPQRSDTKPIAIEQLPTGRFRVTNAVVSFRDELTGRGPWSISGVSFDLTRDTNSMRLTGEASLPESLGHALRFSAHAEGGLQEPEAVVSTFTVAGEGLDLAGWADVFPDTWPAPETGRGSLQLSASLRGPQLTQFTANVDFRNISTALPMWSIALPRAAPMPVHPHDDEGNDEKPVDEAAQAGDEQTQPALASVTADPTAEPALIAPPPLRAEMVSYERVALSVRAHQMGGQWRVTLSDLDVSRTDAPWRSDRIEAQWTQADDALEAKLKADRIVLGNVWPLLAYFPESESLARLRALRAEGVIEALSAEFARDEVASAPRYTLEASLANLGFAPMLRSPGLSGISGKLTATQRGGELQVQSRDVGFELPRMFRDALAAQSVDGTIAWTISPDGITASSEELEVVSLDGRASGAVQVFVPRDGTSPLLRLTAQGEDLNVAATAKYVPGHKLRRKTLEWFDRAFVTGRIPAATFSIDGPVRTFPFRDGEGSFKAQATVEDATLAYHEDWLPASDIDAELEFRNAGMTVRASSAQIGSLAVTDATATIRDFKQTDLRIAGRTSGELADALAFLEASPLATTLAPHLQRIESTGAMSADVQLYFPIKHMEDRDVSVTARLADASLAYGDLAPLRALHGTIKIHNTLLEAAEIEGRWLSGPLSVQVEPQDASSSRLTARGRAGAAPLKTLLALPASIGVSGAAEWEAQTTLSTGDRTFEAARLTADVRDLALALPAPIGKEVGEAGLLDVELTLEEQDRVLARASLGELRALVSVKQSRGEWQLDRGGLRADGVTASLPSHRGIRIEGAIERFVLDDWLDLKGSGEGKPLSSYLQAANVRVGHFEMFGYQWADMRGILQATPSGWRIDVSGPGAAGQVLIPEPFVGASPLRAAMERLALTKADREASEEQVREEDEAPTDPRKLPGLDVHIMDVQLGERSIGAVDLSATRSAQGLRFDEIRVSGPSVRAEGRGNWFAGSQGARSSLTATVTSTDVSATLQALDYTPFIEAQHGEIRADLNWPGGFDANILEQASGTISVRAENGQIVNLQPGAGRMLGLFSVAALPRRLALDFSDLTDKGLAFDTIHGDFDLRDGNAYTDNLLLRGPAAEIGIAGRTGFATRDYDQTAVVTGNLGASLPVAGALAGGPAVGAALLLFSQVFKEPLKGMTRGYYRITGPWENPNVERVGASDAKDATASAARP